MTTEAPRSVSPWPEAVDVVGADRPGADRRATVLLPEPRGPLGPVTARRMRRALGVYAVVWVLGTLPGALGAGPAVTALGLGLVLPGGGFLVGDIGLFDDDGMLWFSDRRKDVIKTGGENVASLEVEKALYDNEPRIGETVVVGLPHPRWSEAIAAVVTPRAGETLAADDVLAAARRTLPGFKVPKTVIFLDEMPRTATGKIQKNVLRERFHDHFDGPTVSRDVP